MKNLFFLLLLINISSFGQRFSTNIGATNFEASISTLIPVKANNTKSKVILDQKTNDIAILLHIVDFKFKISLMQEHFNENYMETSNYPKASFLGKIINKESLKGQLTIKGVSKEIEVPITFKQTQTLSISGTFNVKPEDFKIKVPKIVSHKMAEEVTISFDYTLQAKN